MEHDALLHHRLPSFSLRADLSRNRYMYVLGFGSWLAAVGLYAAYGFSWGGFLMWGFSMFWIAIALFQPGQFLRSLDRKDLRIGLGLVAAFAPLYLLLLYQIPFQVGFDEISVMVYEKIQLTRPLDLFGISEYASFPAAMFLGFAWLGQALGGITLVHMRLIHALSGLVIILLSYFFLVQFCSRKLAVAGTVVLGANHAFFAISRMAQWDNVAVLLELAALIALFKAMDRRSPLIAFLAGLLAGLTFYVYFPSRATFPIWLAAMAVLVYFGSRKYSRQQILHLGALSLIGFSMVVAPVLISSARNTRVDADYAKRQLLIFPEGRALQQEWMHAQTVAEGVWINISHGLTTFNNLEHDQGFVYPNRGHGFLDPLSGVLLWAGVVVVLGRAKQRRLPDVVALIGFATLWLFYSFIVNQSPNYTRLLVTLPFVAYFVVIGLDHSTQFIAEKLRVPSRSNLLYAAGGAVIVIWNLLIYADFVSVGIETGNLPGATGRFIERRSKIESYEFHLIANEQYPYYSWGGPAEWMHWMGTFLGPDQDADVITPQGCLDLECVPPFAVFMSQDQWLAIGPTMHEAFPNLELHNMVPNGTRLAVEVLEEAGGE